MIIALKFLAAIPGFIAGALVGLLLFALLPSLLFIVIWYGGDAYHHAHAVDVLFRPAALVGGVAGAIAAVVAAFELTR